MTPANLPALAGLPSLAARAALAPRPYQSAAITDVLADLDRSPILVLPTGGGKTFTAALIVQHLNRPTLWLAHRKELIRQAAGQLQRLGLRTQLIMPGAPKYTDFFGFSAGPTVYVASVDTLSRRAMPEVGLVVSDECHHDVARNRLKILKHYESLSIPRLGLTATPFRLDGRGLGECGYQKIIVGAWPDELVDSGTLHAPRVYAGQAPDLTGVGKVGADYNLGRLARKMNHPALIAAVVANWKLKAAGKRTVVFAVNIEHSQAIVKAFNRAGVPAEHLDGSSADRDGVLRRLEEGRTLVVSNCMVWTEGTDIPALECAVLARATMSLNLHIQMVGRIMRACEGKNGALVLDHAGNHDVHGLVTRRLSYSLEGKVVAGEADPLGLRRCGRCFLLYKPSLANCPECGWAPEKRKVRQHGPGGEDGRYEELVEFVEDFDYRARFWRSIEAQREAYGFKEGWSAFRYKERFGVWPDVIGGQLVDPKRPTLEQRRAAWAKFSVIAAERGYKPGWAKVRYKELFGEWPSGIVTMTPAVRSSGAGWSMAEPAARGEPEPGETGGPVGGDTAYNAPVPEPVRFEIPPVPLRRPERKLPEPEQHP